jgi:hypothetical protein
MLIITDMIYRLQRQVEWSKKTFGPGRRSKGVVEHIRKELTEIEASPDDLSEWIDVIILGFDGAWRAGFTPEEILEAWWQKHLKNEKRAWPDWQTKTEDQAIEHDRSEGDSR